MRISRPMPGGAPLSPSSNFRGDLEVWDVDSSSPPSVSAIGRVSAKVSSVEQLAEEKLLHEQWGRSDVLEVVKML